MCVCCAGRRMEEVWKVPVFLEGGDSGGWLELTWDEE